MSDSQTGHKTPETQPERTLETVLPPSPEHWVGDGFLVRTVFWPQLGPDMLSPFLMLDHASKRYFAASSNRRGVGEHPHRGFETVTIVYDGEVEHRDSAGGGGRIGPGDVQWMTAASGLVHEEMHSLRFTQEGGHFEVVQLWINLPTTKKKEPPSYQALSSSDFPRFRLGDAHTRLIAGTLENHTGPAKTHTPIVLFDLTFDQTGISEFCLPSGYTTLVCVLEGEVLTGSGKSAIPPQHFAVYERDSGDRLVLETKTNARLVVLAGEPIREPVFAYGPFVMNTREEVLEAYHDYQTGKMGHLA